MRRRAFLSHRRALAFRGAAVRVDRHACRETRGLHAVSSRASCADACAVIQWGARAVREVSGAGARWRSSGGTGAWRVLRGRRCGRWAGVATERPVKARLSVGGRAVRCRCGIATERPARARLSVSGRARSCAEGAGVRWVAGSERSPCAPPVAGLTAPIGIGRGSSRDSDWSAFDVGVSEAALKAPDRSPSYFARPARLSAPRCP